MNTSKLRVALKMGLLSLILLGSHATMAQQGKPNEKAVVPPPPTQRLSEDLEPTVTIKQVEGQQVEEFRIRGKLYMMRVTPKGGGKPYVLLDKQGTGHFEVGENYSPHLSVPQWVIMEF